MKPLPKNGDDKTGTGAGMRAEDGSDREAGDSATGAQQPARLLGEPGQGSEQSLQERLQLSNLSAGLAAALLWSRDLGTMLYACAEAALRNLDVAAVVVWLDDGPGGGLSCAAAAAAADVPASPEEIGALTPRVGEVFGSAAPLLLDGVNGPEYEDAPTWARGAGACAFACYPLAVEGGAMGVVAFYGRRVFSRVTVRGMAAASIEIALGVNRWRTEQALRASEEQFRAAFEQAAVGFIQVDGEGRLVRVNERCCALTGLERTQLEGRELADLFRAEPGGSVAETLRRLRAGEAESAAEEWIFRRWDGEPGRARVTLSGLRNSAGAPGHFLAVVEDVTDARRAEQALREKEEQLRQSQKMETVGRLAGGVAHDFNNILTIISGHSSAMLAKMAEGDPLRARAVSIDRAADRAARLTQQLLAFGRKQLLKPQALDLNALVTEAAALLRPSLGENVEVDFRLSSKPAEVFADPGQLDQVFMNLALNARDAMPGGGRLRVETSHVHVGRRDAERFGVRPGGYVKLAVTDTGEGIPPDVQEQIFEPFFTTKPKGKGTGLGLSTVYGIVRQSDGYITLESAPGHGTSFYVYLPGGGPARGADAAGDESLQAGGTRPAHATVLLVEDEEELLEILAGFLEESGYRVLAAADGEEALKASAGYGGEIDLLVTDVAMPGLSGRELAERLAAERASMRVLYMSGYTSDAAVREGVRADEVAFIQKPFKPPALESRIREMLGLAD